MKPVNPRRAALALLLDLIERGRSLDDSLASEWFRTLGMAPRDVALCRELAWGLCRWYFELRRLLAPRLRKPLRERDRDVELILLLGLYQLRVMRTGAHAAVHESVELARSRRKPWATGLVNAVLRGFARETDDSNPLDPRNTCPDWITARIRADWGERAEAVLAHCAERAPMSLRVDLRQASREAILAELEVQGISALAHATVDSAICLRQPVDVSVLPGFERGLLSVQDAAAQLAAELLSPPVGSRVLDACAAPGGKTLQLAQTNPDIELDALEIDPSRAKRIAQNLERGGVHARLLTGDASRPAEWHQGDSYAAILADVPCSASGVLRRHPDVRLLRRESDIMPLVKRQSAILDSLWQLLQPGGRLLYCTCSIFRDENDRQVDRFLQRHDDARVLELEARDDWVSQAVGAQILTGEQGMDGFYYALLTREQGA